MYATHGYKAMIESYQDNQIVVPETSNLGD